MRLMRAARRGSQHARARALPPRRCHPHDTGRPERQAPARGGTQARRAGARTQRRAREGKRRWRAALQDLPAYGSRGLNPKRRGRILRAGHGGRGTAGPTFLTQPETDELTGLSRNCCGGGVDNCWGWGIMVTVNE